MAKELKNLPIDHKWHDTGTLGAMAKPHTYVDGEYVETNYDRTAGEYPKVKYHADFVAQPKDGVEYSFTELPQVVNSREEEEELGSDWKDSPGAVGVITAPDAEQNQKKKRAQAAVGANWRAAVPGNNPDITEHHLKFLQAQGVEVKTLADVYTFLSGLTSQQMKSFLSEAKEWKGKKG